LFGLPAPPLSPLLALPEPSDALFEPQALTRQVSVKTNARADVRESGPENRVKIGPFLGQTSRRAHRNKGQVAVDLVERSQFSPPLRIGPKNRERLQI
jgi:hypothetical protein